VRRVLTSAPCAHQLYAPAALGSLAADGEVMLLVERPAEGSPYTSWTAVEDARAVKAAVKAAQQATISSSSPVNPLSGEAVFDQDGRDAGKAVLGAAPPRLVWERCELGGSWGHRRVG
jgi:hypothetical protein